MQIRNKVMPLVLSGTLAFGTMGTPLSAYATTIDIYDTDFDVADDVELDLYARIAAGEIDVITAEEIWYNFFVAVEGEEAALEALEEFRAFEPAEPADGEKDAAPADDEADDATYEGDEPDGEWADDGGGEYVGDGDEWDGECVDGQDDSGYVDGSGDSDVSDTPEDPTNPDNPSNPDDPANPDNPNNPDDPENPADPTDPVDPVNPDDPDNPTNTDDPENPADSDNPENPVNPGDSSNPENPDNPNDPETPGSSAIEEDPEPAGSLAAYLEARAEAKAAKGKHAKAAVRKAFKEYEKYQETAKVYAEEVAGTAFAPSAFDTDSNVYASAYASSNEGYSHIRIGTNLTTEMFIASIGEQARQIGQEKNLYASVMIAQAVIESSSGNSGLAKAPNNNLFGIKGAYEGQSVTMATQEDDGTGRLYGINSAFRKYQTQEESLKDYADLLRGDMVHYYRVWKENADTYAEAAKALQGTYATSTVYADTICAVIEAYDLTRYDKPLDFTITGKNADGKKLTMNDYARLEANAVSFLGTPYTWGGTTPEEGFDCSGFVQYLYKQTFGISLPRTTYTQQYEGEEVAFKDLQLGDLLFFAEGGSTEHVAMYLGDGFYIHAPEQGDVIKIADMDSFKPTFAKRILTMKETKEAKKAKHAKEAKEAKAAKEAKEAKLANEAIEA